MTGKLALAWLVHLYTALGAVVAFLTIILIEQLKFQEAFWLMSLAVVIDATDGTWARAARVKELIPWFDGDRLEDIIDYANYVIVPCWFFIRADLLPAEDALWLASLPLLASAYGFCQKEAKTSGPFFSRLSVLLEYRCFLFLHLAIAALDQCLRHSLALDSGFCADQIYLPQSKPALSPSNQQCWNPLGGFGVDNYLPSS